MTRLEALLYLRANPRHHVTYSDRPGPGYPWSEHVVGIVDGELAEPHPTDPLGGWVSAPEAEYHARRSRHDIRLGPDDALPDDALTEMDRDALSDWNSD